MCTPPSLLQSHKSQARPLKATPTKSTCAHHPQRYDRTNHRRAHLKATPIKPTCAHHPQCYVCTNHRHACADWQPHRHAHTILIVLVHASCLHASMFARVKICKYQSVHALMLAHRCLHLHARFNVCAHRWLHVSMYARSNACTLHRHAHPEPPGRAVGHFERAGPIQGKRARPVLGA